MWWTSFYFDTHDLSIKSTWKPSFISSSSSFRPLSCPNLSLFVFESEITFLFIWHIHPTCFNLSRLNRMFSIYTSSSLCYLFSQWLILLMFLFRLFWIMSATFIALFCVLNTLAVLSNGPVDRTVLISDDS